MKIRFERTERANASAATLFEVITDYPSYPRFNAAVVSVRVVRKDPSGAEFVANRTTWVGRTVRAYDRYDRSGTDVVIERTYEGNASARSTWTIRSIDSRHASLTIEAEQRLDPIRGVVLRPALRRLFHRINFTPFITEAERRAVASVV